ncbi:hypothetical protein CAPTEDRAFT_191651 [Capitella teleta]|uniref:RRM domain-containing protein n=1 Tax=Capitella teleta TaxID=283909 RepID=R7TJP1_CAPTE|nr:hypothetical protein CAPTEDRAFT_191651 [Capitella teleta]|eukprot:ELT91761.1 hypothetical protein CAPTEDRAFT_191651 [Capitella teleta]
MVRKIKTEVRCDLDITTLEMLLSTKINEEDRPCFLCGPSKELVSIAKMAIWEYNKQHTKNSNPLIRFLMASLKPPARKDRSTIVIAKVETEADRQFKELVQKQICTDVSLHRQLETKKNFEKSTVHDEAITRIHGATTLEEFRKIQKEADGRQELRGFGLTEAEIDVKLKADCQLEVEKFDEHISQFDNFKEREREIPPAKKSRMLERIEEKIKSKLSSLEKPTAFASTKQLTRHEMDLERAVRENHAKGSHFDCLVAEQVSAKTSHKYPHPDHPMNNITSLFDNETEEAFIGPMPKPEGFVSAPMESKDGIIGPWQKVESPKYSHKVQTKKRTGTAYCVIRHKRGSVGCLHKTNDTRARILDTEVKVIPPEVIATNRLSLDQIRGIPKFSDYQRGEPTETLFVKNLHPSVDEAELSSPFLSFQEEGEERIIFRLLCGRMKGQAFVRFPNTTSASAALNAINGFRLKDRPMIIQFARTAGDSTT